MSNKLLLNLLQQKAQRQAYGGCMNGGVFTEAQRAKAKETRDRNKQDLNNYLDSYGPLSKKERAVATFNYKLDLKEQKKALKQPRVYVRKERDPNQPRKKYPRKPNINEYRIEELMKARKNVDICGFTPASLRKKGQEQRISDLEAIVANLTPLRQIKKINNRQKLLKYDPSYYNPDMAQFEDPEVLVEEVKQAVEEQQIPIEVAQILIEEINKGEINTGEQVAEAVAEMVPKKKRGRKPKAKTGAGRYYY